MTTKQSSWEKDFRRRFGSPHCEHLKPGITTRHLIVHFTVERSKAFEDGYRAGIEYQKKRWRRWFRFLP